MTQIQSTQGVREDPDRLADLSEGDGWDHDALSCSGSCRRVCTKPWRSGERDVVRRKLLRILLLISAALFLTAS